VTICRNSGPDNTASRSSDSSDAEIVQFHTIVCENVEQLDGPAVVQSPEPAARENEALSSDKNLSMALRLAINARGVIVRLNRSMERKQPLQIVNIGLILQRHCRGWLQLAHSRARVVTHDCARSQRACLFVNEAPCALDRKPASATTV
jgi:predicted component of type VI protein secretion system